MTGGKFKRRDCADGTLEKAKQAVRLLGRSLMDNPLVPVTRLGAIASGLILLAAAVAALKWVAVPGGADQYARPELSELVAAMCRFRPSPIPRRCSRGRFQHLRFSGRQRIDDQAFAKCERRCADSLRAAATLSSYHAR